MEIGLALAILGAALSASLGGAGSAIGVGLAGKAAAGVTAQKPELFGKMLIMQALPGTQGIYGFLTAILIMVQIGVLGGEPVSLTVSQGLAFLFASLPIAVGGLLSGIFQGSAVVSAIHMTAKQPELSAKGITITAMVETYAILALLVSILLIYGIAI